MFYYICFQETRRDATSELQNPQRSFKNIFKGHPTWLDSKENFDF